MPDRTKLRVAGGVVVVVLVALGALWEPLAGIFRQTVLLNYLFLGILGAITVVAGAGLLVSLRSKGGAGRARNVIRTVAIVEVVFLITVWVTVFATGAIESFPTSPAGRSQHLRLEE